MTRSRTMDACLRGFGAGANADRGRSGGRRPGPAIVATVALVAIVVGCATTPPPAATDDAHLTTAEAASDETAETFSALGAEVGQPALEVDPGAPTRPAAGARPEGCGDRTFTFHFHDPAAPPPDLETPPVVAVVPEDLPLEQADLEELLARVTTRVALHTGLPIVPRDEARRAEHLVALRKWSADGPACGQAPPLPAILAADNPHLVIAYLSSVFQMYSGQGGEVLRTRTLLVVRFVRAGAEVDGREGPEPGFPILHALVEDPEDPADWLSAANELAQTSEAPLAARIGIGGARRPAYVHVSEPVGTDPWLRIGHTLSGDEHARLIECYPGPAVAAFELGWTISEEGVSTDVQVEVLSAPPGFADSEEIFPMLDTAPACIATVIEGVGWPCPRGGAPVRVGARVCLGTCFGARSKVGAAVVPAGSG